MNARRAFRIAEAATLLLLVGALSAAAAESTDYFRKAKKPKTSPYAIQASVGPKKAVFDIKNAAPGDSGSSKVTLANVGTQAARIEVRRIRMARSELTPYLTFSMYDTTTKECLYPKPKAPKPKPTKKGKPALRPKASGPCKTMGLWQHLPPKFDIAPIAKGTYVVPGLKGRQWKKKERHVLAVRWQVAATAPNAAAGKSATFTLRWIAQKK